MNKIITVLLLCFITSSFLYANSKNKGNKIAEVNAVEFLKNQPIEFIENKGQLTKTNGKVADEVLFKASYGNCNIYITNKGLSYVFVKFNENEEEEFEERKNKASTKNFKDFEKEEEENRKVSYYRMDMNLEGANIDKTNIIKEEESRQGYYNYFYAHCPNGIYNVKGYGKITIKNIYKGIDWVIYTNPNSKKHPLKYDFIVHPKADYKDIKIKYVNVKRTILTDNDTKLKIKTIAGTIEEGNLLSYVSDISHNIQSKFVIDKESVISFEIADYDKTKTLVIDPLIWATYYGGSTSYDGFTSICTDSLDNIYVVGYATSSDFPTLYMNAAFWQSSIVASNDITIIKFNNQGVRLWATFYGGGQIDIASDAVVDNQNNLFVIGYSYSSNFPTQSAINAYNQQSFGGASDGCILKFNSQGVRLWATYYGGTSNEFLSSITCNSLNQIYITGYSNSSNLPVLQLANAYWQASSGGDFDSFILKFSNQGVRQWATYYGGDDYDVGYSVCVDHLNNLYFVGGTFSQNFPTQQMPGAYWQASNAGNTNAFIVKFNPQGVRQWATYYGGDPGDNANSVVADSQNNIFVTGRTFSANFPIQALTGAYNQPANAGDFDLFILKFNNQGVRLWATYYGGSNNEGSMKVSSNIDLQDNLYVTGGTMSSNFPTQQLQNEYWQPNLAGIIDNYILKFNNQGVRQWATYYGEFGNDWGTAITVDNQNAVYFIGEWNGANSYTVDYGNGAYYDNSWNGEDDSFILKISPCNTLKPTAVHTDRNNFCSNDNGNITLTAIGGIGDTLRWFSGGCGLNMIGINSPLTIASPSQTTTYYARWESQCDTSACDSVVVYTKPISIDTLNSTICQGDTFFVGNHYYLNSGTYKDTLISNVGCDSIVITYLTVNPIKITTINPSICQGENYQFGNQIINSSGIYSDTLSSTYGCDSIIICNLTVNQYPYVNLGNDTSICEGTPVLLNATTPNATYYWQDGSKNAVFMVYNSGLYWVNVNVNNCIESDSIMVNIENCNTLYIPNAFIPAGVNKIFKPVGNITAYTDYYMAIYNRWGQMIFDTTNFDIGWDGSYKNEIVQSGVYVYYMRITFAGSGKTIEKKGIVTLVK